jgi:uncharacterized membrane protein YjgN (DUF898 family)
MYDGCCHQARFTSHNGITYASNISPGSAALCAAVVKIVLVCEFVDLKN